MELTARQQRRLDQKLARKAQKHAQKHQNQTPAQPEPEALAPLISAPGASATVSISEAKVMANRANALLSTGATTQAGKATVSQNATKHGLTGKFQVLPGESQEDFDALVAGLMEAEEPADQEEVQYVQYMAEATWLSRRAVRLQDQAILTMQCGTPEEQKQARKDLALFLRYMTTHDRAYSRYATELRKHRNERRRTERGFVSQKHKEAAEHRREAAARRQNKLHQARQALQNVKLESQQIRNRLAAAKAEALELKNLARKTEFAPQTLERALTTAA